MAKEKVVRLASAGREIEVSEKSETDHLVDEIRARIVSLTLPPGSRLRESQFAEEFGVSRARVRDAFGILEERGLIERIPNRGAVVMRLEADDIYDLFEVREVLEAQMVRLATLRSSPGDWDELIELFGEALESRVTDNDLDAYMAAIAEFRTQCIEMAGNAVLTGLLDSIYDRIQGMTRRLVLVPGRALKGFHQHQEILQAMRAGEADKAETLKRENIRSAQEWFQKYQNYLL
jgi:DNA-binding GntR family transcriptional regulator